MISEISYMLRGYSNPRFAYWEQGSGEVWIYDEARKLTRLGKLDTDEIVSITASGEDLDWILRMTPGLPYVVLQGMNEEITWKAPWAQFIYDNLIYPAVQRGNISA